MEEDWWIENANKAQFKAETNYVLAYLTVGAVFAVVQVIDKKFLRKHVKGYSLFLVQISKGIVPFATAVVLFKNPISGPLNQPSLIDVFMVWFLAIVTWYVLLSPVYFVYWLFHRKKA